MTKNQK